MKPIQETAELALVQALRCVQYRMPNSHGLKPRAYSHALGLRYGLIGTAAAFYTLDRAATAEERDVKQLFQFWPSMVAEHFRKDSIFRLPFDAEDSFAGQVGRLSGVPLKIAMALRKQNLPIERVLQIVSEIYCRDHRMDIASGAWFLKKRQLNKLFEQIAVESVHFALCFFDRRRAGLEEVSEIALLGE